MFGLHDFISNASAIFRSFGGLKPDDRCYNFLYSKDYASRSVYILYLFDNKPVFNYNDLFFRPQLCQAPLLLQQR